MKVSPLKVVIPPTRFDHNLQPIFIQVNIAEIGMGAKVECESQKEAESIKSSLYNAYNNNKQFVKERGFGVRCWSISKTSLQVIKVSAEDVLAGLNKKHPKNIDRVMAVPIKRHYKARKTMK